MNTATAKGGTRLLANGNQVPVLGLGVWQVPDGRECVDAVRWALETGYRHIDTAQAYGNEESVGRALRDSGVPRDQVFITTKFYPRRNDPVAQAEKSLRRLGVEQLDLYLVHWPEGGATWAWAGLERARELGLARSIGVSNFSAAELDAVIAAGTIPPAVNQVQFNPQHYRRGLLEACGRHSVAVEAYSPLGTGRYVADATVAKIAQRAGRTPAQALLRWSLQHGLIVITKSTHRVRIQENAQIFDFTLSADDMAELDALDRTDGTDRALESTWWQLRTSAGIYDELTFTSAAEAPGRAYLDWTARALGLDIDGITVLTVGSAGTFTSIALHDRPLGAVLVFSRELGRRLDGLIEPGHFDL